MIGEIIMREHFIKFIDEDVDMKTRANGIQTDALQRLKNS